MTSSITIRHLGPGDLSLLLSGGDDVFDRPVRPDQARAFLDGPGHEIVLALDGANVLGMASGTILLHPDKAPQFPVNELGVAERYRKRGIGTRLMKVLLGVAVARGCDCAWLGTEDDNVAARAVYRRLGGAETAGLVVYEWDDLDDGLPLGGHDSGGI